MSGTVIETFTALLWKPIHSFFPVFSLLQREHDFNLCCNVLEYENLWYSEIHPVKLNINSKPNIGLPGFLPMTSSFVCPPNKHVSELYVFHYRLTFISLVPSNAQFVPHFSVLLSAIDLFSEQQPLEIASIIYCPSTRELIFQQPTQHESYSNYYNWLAQKVSFDFQSNYFDW